jgi:serine/threonine-protein kinase
VSSQDDSEATTELFDPFVLRARGRVGITLCSKWRLDVLLGVGGMAAVYASTHRNGSRVAIKVLHPELSANREVRARFLREGYVANAVGHEGAVKVSDDDTAEDGSLFLVTELLDGESLEDRRRRLGGRLAEDEVLSVADQLLDVLVAAHAKGVVHRDIKPENVFLTRAGQVKVLDFGIARLRELSTTSTATRAGASMGTPAYMPPEQARGLWGEVDVRTDLWAVGATMFHLLTGNLVHQGRTPNERLLSAMTKTAPPLASLLANIGPAVAHVVDRALAFDREKRWPDAHRMQEAVRHAYHDRYGKPITTAPRLAVPETVPNRTLPSATGALAPQLPSTSQPVETPRRELAPHPTKKLKVTVLVLGTFLTIGIAVGAIAWVVSVTNRGKPIGASSASTVEAATEIRSAAAIPVVIASSASGANEVPEIAATDLPAPAPETVPPGRSPLVSRPPLPALPHAPTSPASASPPNCKPPFFLDPATGMRRSKRGCTDDGF